ncbi:hypothetical protein CF319_g880 [Tilletia indica]|uniref:Uncharacterized protein n=1 Tax=Tilletia indica TaxID=43049 RepID=A0A177TNS5_9BASI|nr:hypothetical protein CF319_g880 [Tilletia indica]KAE8246907.1 hypothetical protein A4X13_0g5577 [Tilletia indica]
METADTVNVSSLSKDIDVAERSLSAAFRNLDGIAQAAGYTPQWDVIVKRLGVANANPSAAVAPDPRPPARQRFDCVSVPSTSLLLAAAAASTETWARPGRKPTPREEVVSSDKNGSDNLVSKTPKKSKAKRSRKAAIECYKCGTSRGRGDWRYSVLGRKTPALCPSCYGKEFRKRKKVSA